MTAHSQQNFQPEICYNTPQSFSKGKPPKGKIRCRIEKYDLGLDRRISISSTASCVLSHRAVVAKIRTSCPAFSYAFARFHTTCSVPPQPSNERHRMTRAIFILTPPKCQIAFRW